MITINCLFYDGNITQIKDSGLLLRKDEWNQYLIKRQKIRWKYDPNRRQWDWINKR